MIYTAKKNGHTRVFSTEETGGMAKLLYYRRNSWEISASLGRLEREPRPAPQINKEKVIERRKKRYCYVLGCRVVLD